MQDYYKWLDETNGIVPELGRPSFNNILYLAELMWGREINGRINVEDMSRIQSHIELNQDENGLYKPKNSHDNMTALVFLCLYFNLLYINEMSLGAMLKKVWYRPWDAIFYMWALSGKIGRFFLAPLMLLVFGHIAYAIVKKHKVRPKLHERVWWTLTGKPYELRYMQNDGKILGMLKCAVLKDQYPATVRFLHGLYIRHMGAEYPYVAFYNYFQPKDHPVILEWRMAARTGRDPLK